ncbi:MAG: thiocillin family RiPP [Actinomycetaceae bacterium]
MYTDDIELYADDDVSLEALPDGNALSTWFSAGTASTASCPGSTAASVSSGSCFG